MTVKVTRDAINLREKLSELDKPAGIAGTEILRADTPQEVFNYINAGRRNLIINGAMQVWQRGTSFTGLSDTNSQYTADRWRWAEAGTSTNVYKVEQSTDAPNNFGYSLKATVTTGGTLAANNMYRMMYRAEARDCQSLGYGTSDAKEVTVSFWVKASEAADYSLALYKSNSSSRIISKTYTINSPDTWEYKVVTFSGDTVDGIPNDSSIGMDVSFTMAVGSDFSSTTATTWTSYATNKWAKGHTASQNTTNDYFAITGVQLEVGSVATPFEHRSYGEELALCQRYYYRWESEAAYSWFSNGQAWSSTELTARIHLPVTMRAAQSLTYSGSFRVCSVSCTGITSMSLDRANTITPSINVVTGGVTAGNGYGFGDWNDSSAWIALDAEL